MRGGSAAADYPSRSPPKPFITGDFIRLRQASADEIATGFWFAFARLRRTWQ